MAEFFNSFEMQCFYRLLVAGLCGMLIGWERKNRSKEAGIRTHFVVACASALMMIVSKYGFYDLIANNLFPNADVRLDPSRVAQGIVTGTGFLGAGMIFINKNVVKGLTTAAGVWATSGIGMALGAGMYFMGISMTVLLLLVQLLFHGNIFSRHTNKIENLHIYNIDEEISASEYIDSLTAKLKKLEIAVNYISLKKEKSVGVTDFYFVIEVPEKIREDKILELIDYDCELND